MWIVQSIAWTIKTLLQETRSQFMGKSVGLNSELTRNVGVSVQQAGSLKEMKLVI